METWRSWYVSWSRSDLLAHPDAPAGGTGFVGSSPSGITSGHARGPVPHPESPAALLGAWNSLTREVADFGERCEAVGEAILDARNYLYGAVRDATGYEFREILSGLLPGLLSVLALLAATAALGAVAGAAIGALAGGIGALPGAAVGAEAGLEAGSAILTWLGLGFLVVYIGARLAQSSRVAAAAVTLAWSAPDDPARERQTIDRAARQLALAVGLAMRGVLQGLAAYLLAKGTAAAASRVPELVGKLRASRLGAGFADWMEANWARLIRDRGLQEEYPPRPRVAEDSGSSGGGDSSSGPGSGASKEPSKSASKPPASKSPDRFLMPRQTGREAGAIDGTAPIYDPAPPPAPSDPKLALPEENLDTFQETPQLKTIQGPKTLYRVIGTSNGAEGSYWSENPPPATEAEWRARDAVLNNWNGDGAVATYEIPEGESVTAWSGKAAPQQSVLAPDSYLPGGGDQLYVPKGQIDVTKVDYSASPWNPNQ